MSSLTFPKNRRLLRPAEFRWVYQQAVRFSNDNLTLAVRLNTNNKARIGFGFTKKKVKTAVKRNQLKRICRESFRQAARSLPAVDIVVMARGPVLQVKPSQLHATLESLWAKLRQHYPVA